MLAVGIGLVFVGGPLDAQPKNILTATKVTAPPALDGTVDTAWNGAPPLTVKAVGGKNLPGGSSDVTVRAVYTADTVYFHLHGQGSFFRTGLAEVRLALKDRSGSLTSEWRPGEREDVAGERKAVWKRRSRLGEA
jgi:hypothetical protein